MEGTVAGLHDQYVTMNAKTLMAGSLLIYPNSLRSAMVWDMNSDS